MPVACCPVAVSHRCLPCGLRSRRLLVKHHRSAFPPDGSFQNVPGLLVSRVVTPSGGIAVSSHARHPSVHPALHPRVKGSLGKFPEGPVGSFRERQPLRVLAKSVGPGAHQLDQTKSVPHQQVALARLARSLSCVRGFVTARAAQVNVCGARRAEPGPQRGGGGQTSDRCLYSSLRRAHCGAWSPACTPRPAGLPHLRACFTAFVLAAPSCLECSLQLGRRGCAPVWPRPCGYRTPRSVRPARHPHPRTLPHLSNGARSEPRLPHIRGPAWLLRVSSCLQHRPLCFPRSSRTSDTASTVWT